MILHADTFVEGEETASNKIDFNDVMQSLTSAAAQLRDENAQDRRHDAAGEASRALTKYGAQPRQTNSEKDPL